MLRMLRKFNNQTSSKENQKEGYVNVKKDKNSNLTQTELEIRDTVDILMSLSASANETPINAKRSRSEPESPLSVPAKERRVIYSVNYQPGNSIQFSFSNKSTHQPAQTSSITLPDPKSLKRFVI